jgi:serine/threonine protein kinase
MDWVEGEELKDYIGSNINNSTKLRSLSDEFKKMVKFLHENNLSHGDLQHKNIMIANDHIKLVDYDSFYVPGMENFKEDVKGLPGYQHPGREKLTNLSPKTDYFSELVIYLSLVVYAKMPKLWEGGTEYLLLSPKDIFEYKNSTIIENLLKSEDDEIKQLTERLKDFLKKSDINNLEPLENILIDKEEKRADEVFDGFQPKKKEPEQLPEPNWPDIVHIFDNIPFSKKSQKGPPPIKIPNINGFEF